MTARLLPRLLVRTGSLIATLAVVLLLDFALIRWGGSADPVAGMDSPNLSAEKLREIRQAHRKRFRLDEPLPVQFGGWMADLGRGDLGRSAMSEEPVTERIGRALPTSLCLQGTALILMFPLGIALGVFLARRLGGAIDRFVSGILVLLHAVPVFWLATLLLLFLATDRGATLFPMERMHGPTADRMDAFDRFLDLLWHMVLPVTVLTLPGIVHIARQTRSGLAHALASDYVRTARAAGIPENVVVRKYALRNALGPVAALFGAQIPNLVGGSVIVETIFNVDGLGRLLYDSTYGRDYPVLQSLFLLGAVTTLAGYALSDMLVWWLLPRSRADA